MSAVPICPKCSSSVAAPAGVAEHRWVRCPFCGAEYRLGEAPRLDPPVLIVIDEPAVPAEGKLPYWATLAAANLADAKHALAATQVAMPVGDLPEVELLVPPPLAMGEPVTSDRISDDTDVITFDDSLLLDESTDALPGQVLSAADDSAPAGSMPDEDFARFGQAGVDAREQDESAAELVWPDDDTLEPYEITDTVTDGEAEFADKEPIIVHDSSDDTNGSRSAEFGLPPRRKSRRGSPIMMLVGVVGGGVIGLAIGYAILMWGFSKDPFALGPKLPEMLVPAALRGGNGLRVAQDLPAKADAQPNADSAVPQATDPDDPSNPIDDEPLFPPMDAAPAEKTAIDPAAEAAKTDSDPLPADAGSTPSEAATSETPNPSTPANSTTNDPASATAPPMPPVEATHTVGPIPERTSSVDELLAAVRDAEPTTKAAVTLPREAPQQKRNALNKFFYTNLTKVALALTHLDRDADPAARERAIDAAIGALLDAVPTSQQLAGLGRLGGYWFGDDQTPPGAGIVLIGVVKESKPAGDLLEFQVELLGSRSGEKPRLVTVISPAPLANDTNRVVLIAGTIVNNPAENLQGYEGGAKRVVWGAMAIDPLDKSTGTRP